jgi:YebC/PmpR family DNA-binding regulatory protein
MTDNRNRTVAEVRHLFSKRNGNLGENGCVAWMFDRIGLIQVESDKIDEEQLMEIVLDAGASDFEVLEDLYEITTAPEALEDVVEALENKGIETALAEITMKPQNTVRLEGKHAEQMIKLYEALDEHDDVQKVYANFDIADEVLEQLSG